MIKGLIIVSKALPSSFLFLPPHSFLFLFLFLPPPPPLPSHPLSHSTRNDLIFCGYTKCTIGVKEKWPLPFSVHCSPFSSHPAGQPFSEQTASNMIGYIHCRMIGTPILERQRLVIFYLATGIFFYLTPLREGRRLIERLTIQTLV